MNTVMAGRRQLRFFVAVLLVGVAALGACSGTPSGGPTSQSSSTHTSVPSTPLWAAPGDSPLPKATAMSLQQALDKWVAAGHLVGVSAAVVSTAGTWSGAAGVDGAGTRLKPESAMSIASVTKTFVAAEVMLLSSRGLVNLDAPLAGYVSIPFADKGATVRQALAMRSGFPDVPVTDSRMAMAADLNRRWTAQDALDLIPAEAPGTAGGEAGYNNANYVLLGAMIEKVTGVPLAQALRRDLMDPAGLKRAWVQADEAPQPPLTVAVDLPSTKIVDPAGPYLPSRAAASLAAGSGSIAADAASVARWGYLLYGGHVIDSALVKQMEADPQNEPTMGLYALGTNMTTDGSGTLMVGHGGGGLEWPYTSLMMVWAGKPVVAVAVLTPQPADVATDIYDLWMLLRQTAAG